MAAGVGERPKAAMLVYPGMILLDLNGPQTVFSLAMFDILLVWKDLAPVKTDVGVMVQPTHTFATCPTKLDVLFVPGGLGGTTACISDFEVIIFLKKQGDGASFVTSVCTGSLLLGAAGLLHGYRATSHWYVRDLLPMLGAIPAAGRVVEDRNRITAGGVTAGIDFGLTLVARMLGEARARAIQLVLEYDPQPPFEAGSPESAGADLTAEILRRRAPAIDPARIAVQAAGRRLGIDS
ncbi:DJ-1/PfpI family protein [Roseiarcaceae bacterium H3SJ34-1]|uniref:DJ-1/PfpI family protein n=1 Tax=Terripilifer ovatus TaxID=3032367 RepID=UPI003AB9A871|nr:DJ-1/PfpI family protein [Roseiarcaceae bacterium H3SJ34-1]